MFGLCVFSAVLQLQPAAEVPGGLVKRGGLPLRPEFLNQSCLWWGLAICILRSSHLLLRVPRQYFENLCLGRRNFFPNTNNLFLGGGSTYKRGIAVLRIFSNFDSMKSVSEPSVAALTDLCTRSQGRDRDGIR